MMHTAYPPARKYTHRHHTGGWGSACPHSRRSGMTIAPPMPCSACVSEGEGALILGKSECGNFEFLLFKGTRVVVCLQCCRYGKPGQNHECSGDGSRGLDADGEIPAHPKDEFLRRMLDVVGIPACTVCKGKCSVWPNRNPCSACGGTGRQDAKAKILSAAKHVAGRGAAFAALRKIPPRVEEGIRWPVYTGAGKERF